MLVEVKVPTLSESVAEATLLNWRKQLGEFVERDENLIDIETDKVVLEVPAPASGVLARIIKGDGGTVVANEIIATIDTEAKASTAKAVPAAKSGKPAGPAMSATKAATATLAAFPSAKKIAAEQGVDLNGLEGSGRAGRATKGDVLAAVEARSGAESRSAPKLAEVKTASGKALEPLTIRMELPLATERAEQRVPMSRLRARIAERLLQSQQSAAILTTFNEVNMQPVMDLRNKFKDKFEKQHGVKLGFMSFFAKASLAALKKFPLVNASIDGNDIVYHGYYDIGIAVGSPRGLVVPILRNADQMSFADIEKQIAEFGQRAQDGKLTIEELTGGTFSISNGGVFGSMLSTPIINPPQSGILGVHATKERPVVENGQVVVRPMMYLALSYDHRIIDGREAVLSLVTIKDALEDPTRLLLDV
jgi:2-oxoglutarate dehydrogenase E2 component (dihydrolipoamide succinyltransferase)